jgi:phosphodiesterase/alkaline phosphatase D-like protein
MGRAPLAVVAPLAALALAATGAAALLAAPDAATGPVSSVSSSSATVTGSVDPNGEATGWHVEFGTSTAYGKSTASKSAGSGDADVSVSADLTSLTPSTTYHYRVVAENASGIVHGADAVVATLSAPSPGVSTSAADEIGPFKAKLHGSVDPNGAATSWYFEYGTTTSYGTKTPSQSAGSGSSALGVAVLVQGLQAGVTYHFRLVASSSAGTVVSGDRTFTTDAAPTVKTGSAGSVTATSAVVSGTVNPHGRGSAAWFEYGTTTKYGSRTSDQDSGYGQTDRPLSATLGGLRPGTTYHYRLVGRSDAGTVGGGDRTFRTTATPVAVTGAASIDGADGVRLTGTVTPNGRSTSWYFEYGTTTRYGSRTASHGAGSGTVAVAVADAVHGLRAATTFHYRLVATSSGGTSRGADATFTTLGAPGVESRAVTRLSTTSAVIMGKVNPLGIAATYWIEYGRTTSYGLRSATGSLQPGTGEVTVSLPLSGLAPGVRYHFRLVASSAGGTTTGRDSSFATSPLPRDPRGHRVLCTIVGTVGPDTIHGTRRSDVICSLGGGDVIRGLGGNDVVYAGPGNDVVDGGAGNDVVYGGSGADRLSGSLGKDRLTGGPGRDRLYGGPGADTLVSAGGSRDLANGGPGRDSGHVDRRADTRVSVERLS